MLKEKIKKNARTICMVCAVAGTIGTVISAITATPKAFILLKAKGDEMTPGQIMKTALPAYIPTIIFGCISAFATVGTFYFSEKEIKKITAAYMMVNELFNNYRRTNIMLFGEGNDKAITADIQRERNQVDYAEPYEERLYWLEGAGEDGYFTSTPADVLIAEYEANRILATKGIIHFNEFTDMLGVKSSLEGEDNGWSIEVGYELYNKPWIDFFEESITTDDGLEVIKITCDPEPLGYLGELFPLEIPF